MQVDRQIDTQTNRQTESTPALKIGIYLLKIDRLTDRKKNDILYIKIKTQFRKDAKTDFFEMQKELAFFN